jgi:hypothetical protein
MWTLESSKPVTNKEFQSYVKTTENRINQLKIKGNDNKKLGVRADPDKPIKCFDCGIPGERMGHEGCKQKGKRLHLPKNLRKDNTNPSPNPTTGPTSTPTKGGLKKPPTDAPKAGESEIRTNEKGETERYCGKCRRWTKTHTTS